MGYALGLDDQKMGLTVSLLRLAFAARRQGNVRRGSVCHNPSCFSIVVVATSLIICLKGTNTFSSDAIIMMLFNSKYFTD